MSGAKLSAEEYQAHLTTLWTAAHLIAGLPIPEMIRAGDHAGAMGPVLNPTLWREKNGKLEEDLRMLRVMNGVRTEILRMGEVAKHRAERPAAAPAERAA